MTPPKDIDKAHRSDMELGWQMVLFYSITIVSVLGWFFILYKGGKCYEKFTPEYKICELCRNPDGSMNSITKIVGNHPEVNIDGLQVPQVPDNEDDHFDWRIHPLSLAMKNSSIPKVELLLNLGATFKNLPPTTLKELINHSRKPEQLLRTLEEHDPDYIIPLMKQH